MQLETVLDGISAQRERLHKDNAWDRPHELTDIGNRLAVYNSYLAGFIADAHKEATDKHHAVYLECLAKGEGVTKAEQLARGESTTERRSYEHIKFIYQSTASLVSFIQTKLGVIKNELAQEGKL